MTDGREFRRPRGDALCPAIADRKELMARVAEISGDQFLLPFQESTIARHISLNARAFYKRRHRKWRIGMRPPAQIRVPATLEFYVFHVIFDAYPELNGLSTESHFTPVEWEAYAIRHQRKLVRRARADL
jgi:hypothetical protein